MPDALLADGTVTDVVAFDDLSTGFAINIDGLAGGRLVEATILDLTPSTPRSRARTRSCTWAPEDPSPARWPIRGRRTRPTRRAPPRCSSRPAAPTSTWWWRRRRRCTAPTPASSGADGRTAGQPVRGVQKLAHEVLHATWQPHRAAHWRSVLPAVPAHAAVGHAPAAVVPAFVSARWRAGRCRCTATAPSPGTSPTSAPVEYVLLAALGRVSSAEAVNWRSGPTASLLEAVDVLDIVEDTSKPTPRTARRRRRPHPGRQLDCAATGIGGVSRPELREGLETTVAWYRESLGA